MLTSMLRLIEVILKNTTVPKIAVALTVFMAGAGHEIAADTITYTDTYVATGYIDS